MKKLFVSKQAIIVVDILMLLALVLMLSFSDDVHLVVNQSWTSNHCIAGLLLTIVMMVHVAQHWKFTKALIKKKVMQRNKLTALTTIFFVLLLISFFAMLIGGFDFTIVKFHGLFGRLLLLFIVLHIIYKFKRFLSLFKSNRNT